jgi:glycosyltransferase involved in cell wall biosynthesis
MNRKIGGMGLMRGTSLSERLKDWVTQFSPDIIYSVPTDLATIRLVASLVRATRAKLAVHIYDDWPATLGNGGILEPLYAQTTSPALDDLLELADARIAIGDDMALEYSRRYGHPFYPFQNCPEAEPWATARSERTCDHERGFIFRFFGAIYRNGNLQTLACFARAISLLSDQTKCRLEIHTSTGAIDEYLPLFNGSQGVSLHPVVANDVQMAQLYANADALVLAYDFDEHSRSRFRYSMATKLPTYLLSGTPIVIYAPPDLAVTRHAERTQTGYIIGEELPPVALADRLRQFADSRVLRAEIGLRARQLGLHRYCADTVRPRFWALLRDASAL